MSLEQAAQIVDQMGPRGQYQYRDLTFVPYAVYYALQECGCVFVWYKQKGPLTAAGRAGLHAPCHVRSVEFGANGRYVKTGATSEEYRRRRILAVQFVLDNYDYLIKTMTNGGTEWERCVHINT